MEEYPETLKTRFNDNQYNYRVQAFKEFLKLPVRIHKESPTVKDYVEITDEELERMLFGEITLPEKKETIKFPPNTDILMDNDVLHVNSELEKKGVIITDMRTALVQYRDILNKYTGERYGDERSEYLINSSWQNGVFIYIPSKAGSIDMRSEVVFDSNASFSFKTMIILEDDTSLNLTDTYTTTGKGNAVHGKNIYFFLGKRSKVQYNYLQDNADTVTDLTHIKSFEDEFAEFDIYHINHGSSKVLFSNESNQFGKGSSYRVYGVSFTGRKQKMDIRDSSFQIGEETIADIQVRGVVTGSSSTMHRGNVDMEEDSRKSNGFYDSKILLLSKQGYANTKPALMIKNNDTRSKHGSAISNVDEDQILYLRSRGIPPDEAKRIITAGFVASLIERARNDIFTQKVYEYAESLDEYD